jgi:hypothetical protein
MSVLAEMERHSAEPWKARVPPHVPSVYVKRTLAFGPDILLRKNEKEEIGVHAVYMNTTRVGFARL